MIVVILIIGEGLSPSLQVMAARLKNQALNNSTAIPMVRGVWLHQDGNFIHIDQVCGRACIQGITIFKLTNVGKPLSIAFAKRATFNHNHWMLRDITESKFFDEKIRVYHMATQNLALNYNPIAIARSQRNVLEQSTWDLFNSILYRQRSGLETKTIQLEFWQRVIKPLTIIVMVCLAIPFIFGSLRDASTGLRVLAGILIGFAFYMLNRVLGPIILIYPISPWIGAVIPTLLFAVIFCYLLWRLI